MLFIVIIAGSALFGLGVQSASEWRVNASILKTLEGSPETETLRNTRVSRDVNRAFSFICLALFLALIGWYNLSYSSAENEAARREKPCTDTIMAYTMSQNFVKKRLKAPSTAVFPRMPSEYRSINTGHCTFMVSAYVESQNSFGGMVKTPYTASLRYLPETEKWHLNSLEL